MNAPRVRIPLDDAYLGDLIQRKVGIGGTWESIFLLEGSPSEVFDYEAPPNLPCRYRLVRDLTSELQP